MGGFRTVQDLIDENYQSFAQSTLRRADGDQQKADYLMDCGYWEYFWRIVQYNQFIEAKNKQIEEEIKKSKSK